MELRLLGDLEIVEGDVDLTPRGRKQRMLLALLACHPQETVSVDRVTEALWGDDAPANPANAIQAQIAALRRSLPKGSIVTRGSGYCLDVAPGQIDAVRFEALLVEGRRLLGAGRHADAAQVLRDALDLWRGPALADLAFEEFAQPIAHRLEEERLTALEGRIEAQLALGEHATVLGELEALCQQHPLREHLWAMRMVALYRAGRQADALRAYAAVRSSLVEELGVEPGPELRRAEAMVLAHDDALGARPPVRPDPVVLGNIAPRLDRFIGREPACRQLEELLGTDRMITLIGPGGVGKTRLATELGVRIAPSTPDGVWFVDLTAVPADDGVAAAVAAVLDELMAGAGPSVDQPGRPAFDRLAESLAGTAPVLIVDNCEHVVDGAAIVCHQLVEQVPGLRIVATSREALGVPGERILVVPPLDRSDAAELFFDRSARAGGIPESPDAELIDQICARLDDLPLAIELAASRTRALPLDQIEARLEDRFRLLTGGARTARPRHRALRSVVDWSHDLLDEDERLVFARLSALSQPAQLDAIEAVVADDRVPADAVADLVARLVDKSLVVRIDRPDGTRYGQLQTLRLYAAERLAEHDDAAAVHERHARWYLGAARAASTGLIGADGAFWRLRIKDQLGEFRRAIDWFTTNGDGDAAIAVVNGLAWSWFLSGEWDEAVRWFDLAFQCDGSDDERRALAHQWRAYFATFSVKSPDGLEEARLAYERLCTARSAGRRRAAGLLFASTLNRMARYREALDVLGETMAMLEPSDDWSIAMCDLLVATAALRLGDLVTVERAAAASAERFERFDDRTVAVEASGMLAHVVTIRGDLDEGVRRYTELIERCRDVDLPGYLIYYLVARGVVRLRLGDADAAAGDFAEALEGSRNPVNTAAAELGAARAAAHRGEPGEDGLRRAVDLLERDGDRYGRCAAVVLCGLHHVDRGEPDAAAAMLCRLDDEPGATSVLCAAIALANGDRDTARSHLDNWDAVREQATGGHFGALLAAEHERLLARVT